jgi:histidinol-phosphate aminotransferase
MLLSNNNIRLSGKQCAPSWFGKIANSTKIFGINMDKSIRLNIRSTVQNLPPKQAGQPKSARAVRLDKGEFPYPPSPQVISAIQAAASGINRYPEVLTTELRQAIANYNQVAVEQIFVGNGSDDLIEQVLKICLEPGDEVILPVPTFFVYGAATQMLGGVTVSVPRTADFGLDVMAILAAITSRTKLIFIANPNNPTANLVDRQQLLTLLDQTKCLVVVDECYFEICQTTIADEIEQYPQLIVLRSLSKGFGLAGLRLGYGITNPQLVDYLYRVAQIFPVNQLAIAAGIAALEHQDYVQAKLTEIKQERNQLAQAMENLGLQVYRSDTNFLLVNSAPWLLPSANLVAQLAQAEIFVADFGGKPGLDDYHFRVATGTPTENQQFLRALTSIRP